MFQDLNKRQRLGMILLWILSAFFLMYFITTAILAYIQNSYPELSATQVTQLVTIPNLVGLFVSFLIGPISMKVSKKLLIALIPFSVLCYMVIFSLVGSNGPFWLLRVGCYIAGYAQGSISVLGPIAISGMLPPDKRGRGYSVMVSFQNAGLFIWLNLAGWLAAGNGGADWPRAYLLGWIIIPLLVLFWIFYPSDKELNSNLARGVGANADTSAATGLSGLKKIPAIIIAFTLLQCIYYCANSSYAQNISVLVITERAIGTSVHTGFATSMMRLGGVLMGVCYPLFKKIFKRFLIPVSYGLVALGLFLTAAISALPAAYIGSFLCGFGNTMAFSELYTYVANKSGKYAPVSISFLQGMNNLGVYMTPYVLLGGAKLLGGESALNKIRAGCIIGVICALIALFLYPREMKKDTRIEAEKAAAKEA